MSTIHKRYTGANRFLILSRTVSATLIDMLPVPGWNQRRSEHIQRDLLQEIAHSHGISLDAHMLRLLSQMMVPSIQRTSLNKLAKHITNLHYARNIFAYRRPLFKLSLAYNASEIALYTSRNFLIATLFDYYCTNLHHNYDATTKDLDDLPEKITRVIRETNFSFLTGFFGQNINTLRNNITHSLEKYRQEIFKRQNNRADLKSLWKQSRANIGQWSQKISSSLQKNFASAPIIEAYLEDLLARFESYWTEESGYFSPLYEEYPDEFAEDLPAQGNIPPSTNYIRKQQCNYALGFY